jgi:hypothetical protein
LSFFLLPSVASAGPPAGNPQEATTVEKEGPTSDGGPGSEKGGAVEQVLPPKSAADASGASALRGGSDGATRSQPPLAGESTRESSSPASTLAWAREGGTIVKPFGSELHQLEASSSPAEALQVSPLVAGGGEPVHWNGGPVQREPFVHVDFWGGNWNNHAGDESKLLAVYQAASGSAYGSILTQYFDGGGYVNNNTGLIWYTDERGKEVELTQAHIEAEAQYLINDVWGSPTVNTQIVLAVAPESTYKKMSGCGWHEYLPSLGVTITVIPWEGDEPLRSECLEYYQPGAPPWQEEQATASHEWAESATDPQGGSGWTTHKEELADVCVGQIAEISPGVFAEKLRDDYLMASEQHLGCTAQDGSPIRFGATISPAQIGIHKVQLTGSVRPAGYSASYLYVLKQGGNVIASGSGFPPTLGSGFSPVGVSDEFGSLHGETTYTAEISAGSELTESLAGWGNHDIYTETTFTTPSWRPISTTERATEVKAHTATLHGNVNPQGTDTHYQFEYGTTTSYGSSVPIPAGDIGAGVANVPVSAAISGLAVGTFYHYRVTATNAEGTTHGADSQFETPNNPVITAEAASYVNTLEPTMDATVNPERAGTHYQFEYGTSEAYGTKVPIPAEDIGAGAAVTVEKGLKGLARSTTYHYRVTAENEVGTVHGADRSFTTLPPCKGAEQKCVWSLQEPSNPLPPSKFEMKGVSCASASLCVAVGKNLYNNRSFVDRWNGSAWSLLSGAVPGEMRHLACLASGCMVVGVSGGRAETWFVGEYPVGGGTWIVSTVTTPLPSGSSETVLDGVSCSAASECTAVGSYKGSEGTYHPLVERWNGSAWSLQSAPSPAEGTAQDAMLGVSCISIGCITVGEAAGKPVAETWIGGTWGLSSPKLPAGAKGGKLSSVSCSSTSCIAVGDSNEGAGTEKALAESFELLRWELMAAPNPAGAKGFVELAGVSCPSAGACTATGYYATAVSGGQPTEVKTLAEAWNGSSWTIQSSTNSGQRYNLLSDVSCSAAGACTAVGQDSEGFYAEPETLAERWNGSAWSTQKIVNPEEPLEDEMKAVSCSTNTLCVGVGKNVFAEDGFAEVWNGTEWLVVANVAGEAKKVSCISEGCMMVGTSGGSAKIWIVIRLNGVWGVEAMTAPLPAGSSETVLDSVSCGTETTCTAVGSYKGSEGTYHPLVERWNGSAWSLQSAPNPAEGTAQNAMLGVSCAGASYCMAVGEAVGKPVAEAWNGSEWSLSAPPEPGGAKGATLVGVSCGSTRVRVCMAVGDSYEGTGSEKALAERWNGSAWSIVAVPAPAGAKGFVDLTDVSCLSPNSCLAAGYYAPELVGGAPVSLKTLVESWEGTEWTVLTTPNLASQTYNALAGISCTTSIDCTAVGGATSSLSKRPPVQLAMRFE